MNKNSISILPVGLLILLPKSTYCSANCIDKATRSLHFPCELVISSYINDNMTIGDAI